MGHARGHARAEARRCWRVAFFLSIAGKKISLARPRACSLALLTTTTTTTTRSLVYAEDRKNNAQGLQWKKSRGSSGPQAPSMALGRGSPSRRPITTSVHGLREQEGIHQETTSSSRQYLVMHLHVISLELTFAGLHAFRPPVINIFVTNSSTLLEPSTTRSATTDSA